MTIVASATAGNFTHTLDVTILGQDIAGNYTTVSYSYNIHRNTSASGAAFGGPRNFSVGLEGGLDTQSRSFDFRAYADLVVVSGSVNVAHNADGSKSISASFNGPNPTFTSGFPIASGAGTLVLPTIPRGPKVAVGAAWQQSVAYCEVAGVWRNCIVYAEVAGAWRQAV